MRRILCFGDSNTYGYDPRGGRYDENTRWTKRLDALLGDGWTVVEEGFNGRTCVMDDPTEGGYKSGANYLPPCLMSHNPLDMVAIMLGGNDSKQRFGLNPMTIGEGIMQLIRLSAVRRGRGGQSIQNSADCAAAVSGGAAPHALLGRVRPAGTGGHARAGRGVRPGGAAAAVRISGRGRGGEAVGD